MRIVVRRWAMTMVVRCFDLSAKSASREACTIFSLSLSSALVASSSLLRSPTNATPRESVHAPCSEEESKLVHVCKERGTRF